MKKAVLMPWKARYRDRYGVIVETVGVDIANQWVIYRIPGYEHDCMCPRRHWSRKFTRVEEDHEKF